MQLNVAGDLPSGLDLSPAQAAILVLNRQMPDQGDASINVKFVDDDEIQALNKEYSGLNEPTDVLSFSYIEDGQLPPGADLGDVAISLETAERQATKAGISLGDEVATLVLHGILHILGYDHQTPEQRTELDNLQAEILTEAGVAYRDFNWKD